ncbi:MAG: hypothetical protein AAF499_02770 [Pseudomonadota bacterium]
MGEDDRNAHAQLAVGLVPNRVQSVFDRTGFLNDPPRVLKVGLARFRQADLACGSIQKTRTQPGFKLGDFLADMAWRVPEHTRCGAQTLLLNDCVEQVSAVKQCSIMIHME